MEMSGKGQLIDLIENFIALDWTIDDGQEKWRFNPTFGGSMKGGREDTVSNTFDQFYKQQGRFP